MKKFIAMALAATLAFGSSVMVFADDAATTPAAPEAVTAEAEGEKVVEGAEVVVPVVEEVEEVVEEVVVPVNVPFTGVTTNYNTPGGQLIGQYLVFSNNAALTKTMLELVTDQYTNTSISHSTDVRATNVDLLVSFTVTECLEGAKIEYTLNTASELNGALTSVVVATYYVEKATNKTITAADFAALVAAEEAVAAGEAPAAEAEVVESIMLPLRSYAEGLGFTVDWADGKVTVSKGDAKAFLVTGSTSYVDTVGDTVELEAPENIDGTLFVPIDFFAKVLYVEVQVVAE